MPSPIRPDTATIGAPLTCGSQWSASVRSCGDQIGLALDQIPFVDREHERAALALDQVGNAQILLLEPVLRVHHHHDDFGEPHRAQRVGHRELFQLLLDPRAAAQAGGIEHAEIAALPVDLDRDGIAGGAGFGAGQQPLLAEQMVDQRRFAGIGAADDGNADRARARASSSETMMSSSSNSSVSSTGSGISARSAS